MATHLKNIARITQLKVAKIVYSSKVTLLGGG
jgi:hypothetical protein